MKVFKIFIAALAATISPLSIMWVAIFFGLPKVHIVEILNNVYGKSEVKVAILFISFRILLAFVYVLFFNPWEPIKNDLLRGILFGVFVFLYSEANLLFHLLGKDSELANGSNFLQGTVMLLLASLMFGAVLGLLLPRKEFSTQANSEGY